MRTWKLVTLIGAFLLGVNSLSQASLLSLAPSDTAPDFGAGLLNVTYAASNDTFQAIGQTTDYSNGSISPISLGSFSLTAIINSDGLLTGGTLTVQGDVGEGTENLLTGTLETGGGGTAFGFMDPPGGSLFQFSFTVTGGNPTIMQDFGGTNTANCAVILDAWFENGGVPFDGTWNNDFHNDGFSGLADALAAIPEPSSFLLLLMGGVGCAMLIRKRRDRGSASSALKTGP